MMNNISNSEMQQNNQPMDGIESGMEQGKNILNGNGLGGAPTASPRHRQLLLASSSASSSPVPGASPSRTPGQTASAQQLNLMNSLGVAAHAGGGNNAGNNHQSNSRQPYGLSPAMSTQSLQHHHMRSASLDQHSFGGSQVDMRKYTSDQHLAMMYSAQQHSDYIIADYMDKISTKISLLETELKYAWRALDLLSGEYGKMWQHLEKLENLTVEQQSVLTNLMTLYASTSQNAAATIANLKEQKPFLAQMYMDDYVQAPNLLPPGLFQSVQNLGGVGAGGGMMMAPGGVGPAPSVASLGASLQRIPSRAALQQEAATATEFNEMLEKLKNEAIQPDYLMAAYAGMHT